MSYRALSPETKDALASCQPNGYKNLALTNSARIIRFWKVRNRNIGAFLNLKELTPAMVREIREKILEPNDASK